MFYYKMTRFKVQPINIYNINEHSIGLGVYSSYYIIGEKKKTKRGRL